MRPQVRVEVPDPFVARDLELVLAGLRPVVVRRDRQWCVAVEQGAGATLTQVLASIDSWLTRSGLGEARVVVGGRAEEVEVSQESDRRATRLAENQSLFREVNERVKELNARLEPLDSDLDYRSMACECAHADCTERIELTLPEYESVRANPMRFAVAPGGAHVFADIERVVARTARYWVVEKVGPAGEEAAALDPRAAA